LDKGNNAARFEGSTPNGEIHGGGPVTVGRYTGNSAVGAVWLLPDISGGGEARSVCARVRNPDWHPIVSAQEMLEISKASNKFLSRICMNIDLSCLITPKLPEWVLIYTR
jgi:hypothetical protein